MTAHPGLSVRAAVNWVRRHAPDQWHEPTAALPCDDVAADFASRYAGIPANSLTRTEPVVCYRVDGRSMPVLLGLYGSAERVRTWLPGLPLRTDRAAVDALVADATPPVVVTDPSCRQRSYARVDLTKLPALRATPRDAGPYLTMGVVMAGESLSVHRMLVLGRDRLAIWMVPGRALRRMHEAAVLTGRRLPVSVNIGAPPAAVVASALSTTVLPVGKLALAGAMAGGPVALANGVSQPVSVLAESEIVLEGFLDGSVTDESLDGPPDVSLPEFLGYDGAARADLPVLTVTAVTTRRSPRFQAVIGPGREQSVILGMAGALSVALTTDTPEWRLIADLHYSPAGGGMLLLVVAVRKDSAADDARLGGIARRIFDWHGFVKLIVFTDTDVDITSAEDVLWAVTTRANLGTDCGTFAGFRPLGMDPSHGPDWAGERGSDGGNGRTYVDATVPYALRDQVVRSFRGRS
ncbi:UbiD family decarboxylase [Actinocrispum wychmicini]|uniref:4-hydroxy-3-polyprenylbenzoate decarboxylase n=1 Tax=Actinocrispum wychmicini TaxID=1213861 RepID=A0A4R2K2P5_9PSEU|nr:UbiD family decarboxylase [Actinocrispum wychmicini]TCO60575.1 4-hydroxy-3-polyprenylbenzoate decarboxylase [Actinocrispum wychmicini]